MVFQLGTIWQIARRSRVEAIRAACTVGAGEVIWNALQQAGAAVVEAAVRGLKNKSRVDGADMAMAFTLSCTGQTPQPVQTKGAQTP